MTHCRPPPPSVTYYLNGLWINNRVLSTLTFLRSFHKFLNCFEINSPSSSENFGKARPCDTSAQTTPKEWRLQQPSSRYRMFHRYRQAKYAIGGSMLSSSRFLLMPQLTQKTKLDIKRSNLTEKIVSIPKI